MLVELEMVEDLMDLGLSLENGIFSRVEGSLMWGRDIKVTLGDKMASVTYRVFSYNEYGDLVYDKVGEDVSVNNDNLINFLKELGCRSERESKKEHDEWLKKLEMKRAMMSK